jgi:hypothetical protein
LGVEPIRSALIREGIVVEIHDDHFCRDEEDQVWLAEVGKRNWVVLTRIKECAIGRSKSLHFEPVGAEFLSLLPVT